MWDQCLKLKAKTVELLNKAQKLSVIYASSEQCAFKIIFHLKLVLCEM